MAPDELYLLRPFVPAEYLGYDPETNRLNFRLVADARPRRAVEKFADDVRDGVAAAEEHADAMFVRLSARFLQAHQCPMHTALALTLHCTTCDVFICDGCTVESHQGHATVPRSAYCVQKIAGLRPKRDMFARRIAQLTALLGRVNADEARLLASVDAAEAECRDALEARRVSLRRDAVARGQRMAAIVAAETQLNDDDSRRVADAIAVVRDHQKRGELQTAPFVELHAPAVVRNETELLLPTRVVMQVIQSLDWSLAAKHLTRSVYPDAAADAEAAAAASAEAAAARRADDRDD
jgi:hypothetical protein